MEVEDTERRQMGSEVARGGWCRWENKIFWGETTLHNSQGEEYVDEKGTSLMNLGGD